MRHSCSSLCTEAGLNISINIIYNFLAVVGVSRRRWCSKSFAVTPKCITNLSAKLLVTNDKFRIRLTTRIQHHLNNSID